jgi:hypothetical protein
MKTIELFCGTKSFSKVMAKHGHETFTIDNNKRFNPDLVSNILTIQDEIFWDKLKDADVVWMSPPCTTFSMASGNTHWTEDRKPKTEEAKIGKELLMFCKEIANYCINHKKVFFIENPRARARWFLPIKWRKTVWYCQYGDKRAKPTDIWTNLKGWEGKQCRNGILDHEQAPRGSKTGTQGLANERERGVIPSALFEELLIGLRYMT